LIALISRRLFEIARRSPISLRSLSCALILNGALGCQTESRPTAAAAPAPLATEDPVELIPAAGLRWLLLARPQALLENEAFCGECSRLLPEARLRAFAARTGIELRKASFGLIAGYDLATVYAVVTTEPVASSALVAFRDHLRDGGRLTRPHPRLQRVTGMAGDKPEALMTVGERVALVSVGDLTFARVLEAFALGRLERSPSALRGAALSKLPAFAQHAAALAVLYVPGPFVGEWSRAGHGLLGASDALSVTLAPAGAGASDALSVTLAPAGAGAARFHLHLAGDFPPDASERLETSWSELAESTTGRVLSFDRPLAPPQIRALPHRLELDIQLETAPIAAGLHALLSGEAWEILNLPPPSPL
jgi:hypothetical protein